MYINCFGLQGHKYFDHNENNFVYSRAIRLTGKWIQKWKLQLKIVKTQIFSYRLEGLEIFRLIFYFPFFMHRSPPHTSRNSDGNR